ncbi:hypothetical protein NDU88_002098 [Pleurodeles waltl]|uniref:Uncharacterized protein n=1 Tax=Pleurodeles waltl TaxID=8319 RepID=A0AAV7NFE5_PLEWA|nr:hypothetical protein NDU88_002098 [Pleurodeles waltl]
MLQAGSRPRLLFRPPSVLQGPAGAHGGPQPAGPTTALTIFGVTYPPPEARQPAPSKLRGHAPSSAPQRPAWAKRHVRGPAPARPRAASAPPAALILCPTGRSPSRAPRPPPAASAPPLQQGDPPEVPRSSRAVCLSPTAARGSTRGRGFRRGDGPPDSSSVDRDRLAPQHTPGP